MSKKTVREQVLALLQQRGLNATDVACYVDLAQSTVWNYLAGTRGESQQIKAEMQLFLMRVGRGEILSEGSQPEHNVVSIANGSKRSPRNPKRRRHYETEMVQQVASAIDFCVGHSSIGLITADFGAGKTHAAQLWRRQHLDINSLLFEFEETTASSKFDFIGCIADQLGMDGRVTYATAHRQFHAVVNRLREEPLLLVLDQCEGVRVRVLQLIRQLWDRTHEFGTAVVLLSAPQLSQRLERRRSGDLGALRSRIGVHVALRGLPQRGYGRDPQVGRHHAD